MTNKTRNVHPLRTKIAVGIAMIKGDKTIAEICSDYGIHSTQANAWRKKALMAIETGFDGNPELEHKIKQKDERIDELHKKIGQTQMELEWLKKKMGYTNN
jgi:transposase-like protein